MVGFFAIVLITADLAVAKIDAADVLSGIADREAAVATFSVRLDLASSSYAESGKQSGAFRWSGIVLGDNFGRYRADGQRRNADAAPLHQIQVFDGRARRAAWGQGALSNGREGAGRFPMSVPLNPAELVTEFNGEPTSKYVASWKEGFALLPNVQWAEGAGVTREVLVLETAAHVGIDGESRKAQFYVDSDRGFAVVRKAMLVLNRADQAWLVNSELLLKENTEVEPGIWLPRVLERTLYYIFDNGQTHVATRITGGADEWSINGQFSPSTFVFNFPKGVAVNDETTGTLYIAGSVTDPLIAAQVEEGRRLLSARQLSLLSVSGFIAAIMLGTAFVFRLLRKRNERGA